MHLSATCKPSAPTSALTPSALGTSIWSGGLRYLADLHAHNGLDYVDVASQRWGTWAGQPEVVLVIPSPPRDQAQPLIDDYVLEKGVYEIVVEVGTESDDEFMPTTITLRLVYDSAAGFEMHEIVR